MQSREAEAPDGDVSPASLTPEAAAEPTADELPAGLAELGVSPSSAAAALEARVAQKPPLLMPLGLARISSIDEPRGRAEVQVGGRFVDARIDPTVHAAVLKTADERGEPVLVEQRGEELFIVGALRTQPTPGVDAMPTITLEANRIELRAKQEIAMSSGVAAIAVRAIGEVETYAERIVSRAESVHKIIGRMLRLN